MGRWTKGAQRVRESMDAAGSVLTDAQALAAPALYSPWREDGAYATGDRVRYGDLLYKCVQGHAAQAGWTPEATPALWTRIADPAEEWPEWIKPTGAHNAYDVGKKVSHNGKRWINTHPGNAYEPGVYGWTEQK